MDLLAKKLDEAAEREFIFCASVIAKYFFRGISFEHSALVHGVSLNELHQRLRFFMRTCSGAIRLGAAPVEIPNVPNAVDELFKAGPPRPGD